MRDALPSARQRQWRGPSGKIYSAERLPIAEAVDRGARDGVGLAVARPEKGIALQVALPARQITRPWLAEAKKAGASEIHFIDARPAEAAAIIADLQVSR